MTPSELAKVREALVEHEHHEECPFGWRSTPGPCDCGAVEDNARITEALAILDREAGRKTRTVYVLEGLLGGQWVLVDRSPDRDGIEKYRVNFGEPTRILEVTESWEEPQS